MGMAGDPVEVVGDAACEVPDHRTRRDEASDISPASREAILDAFAAAHG
jgi:hypothetical protein